jgi:hypothetical protein
MFWRRQKGANREGQERSRREGWNTCLDTVEEFLGQHSWVTDEDDRAEIFCDGCGASLRMKLRSLRKNGPSGAKR